ncbi:MAG: substrate-binding domain-containing protein, partial [Woeseiaceae bacterium]
CISIDNQRGGYLATKHVLELGHRKVAYIAGPLWKLDVKERLDGHKRALAEFGLDFAGQLMFEGDFQESSGSEGMRYLLQAGQPFSAVVCANDGMAAGAMKVARESGLKLPDDLSIVGFDNVIIARYLYPQLSTIDYPINEMGRMAARWVFKHVYGNESLDIQHVFEPGLIARESVANAPER